MLIFLSLALSECLWFLSAGSLKQAPQSGRVSIVGRVFTNP